MVALVEDHEAEARAEVLHVQVRRVVGRDRERLDVVLAAADDADRAAEGGAEQVVPLADEIERRRDDERAAPLVVDGQERDVGLAGARRQDDDAAAAMRAPRRERLGLVRPRLAVDASARGELRVAARSVVVRDLRGDERAHDVGVRDRGGAVAPGARVPRAGGRCADSVRPAAHFERAGHERDGDHRRIASTESAAGASFVASISRRQPGGAAGRHEVSELRRPMTLAVVAEKPAVARDIAQVLGARTREQGALRGEGYVVTWAIGHLVGLAEPHELDPRWKEWRMAELPILPDDWRLVVAESTSDQFANVRRVLQAPDVTGIICATDAGREGELIFRYIYEAARCTKPVRRLWISSLTPDAIARGFRELRDGSELRRPRPTPPAARSRADWLVGMNLSRAYSIVHDEVFSVGRVQTPTLAMIVAREQEIAVLRPRGLRRGRRHVLRTERGTRQGGDEGRTPTGIGEEKNAATWSRPTCDGCRKTGSKRRRSWRARGRRGRIESVEREVAEHAAAAALRSHGAAAALPTASTA